MSNHFIYEIDERKLRVKLKDLHTPPTNEAWQLFEAHFNALNKQNQSPKLSQLQIPLNRNVLVPIFFGLIIVLFSFIVFHFITIKNPNPQNAVLPLIKSDTLNVLKINPKPVDSVPKPTLTKAIQMAASTNKDSLQSRTQVKSNITTSHTATVSPTLVKVNSISTRTAISTKTLLPLTPSLQIVNRIQNTKTDSTQTRKKSKKRDVADVVESDSTPERRPNISQDEREKLIRPN